MDRTLKLFIERENIANYIRRLKTETDPAKREVIVTLLNEEEAKQVGDDANANR